MASPVPPSSYNRGRRLPKRDRVRDQVGKPSRSRLGKSFATSSPLPTARPPDGVEVTRSRLVLVWLVLIVSILGLSINLFRLQVLEGPDLRAMAREQQLVSLRPFVPRRPITDRLGNVLAIDRPVFTLYAHPKLFNQPNDAIASALSPILNTPTVQLMGQFNTAETGITLAQGLSEDIAGRLTDLRLDGLELIQQQQRFYPQQDLFADVVGYVNFEREGQAGVEFSQQQSLERTMQTVRLSRSGDGSILPEDLPGGFLYQDDLRLQLTLDSRLQRAARYALKQQVQAYNAKRGAVLVMDVSDGSILSMVSEPSYDPNQYYRFDLERFKNWTLSDLYEPGSTFKPINVAIALEENVIQPSETFYDEGRIEVGGWPIQNSDFDDQGGRGMINITQIIQNSSNIGMVRIMQRLNPDLYHRWLKRLGLGQATGIDLPFEAEGQIKDLDEFTRASIEPATASFGQGFSLTPIQLLQIHGAIANGGQLVTPHLVQGLFDAEGQMHWQPDLPTPQRLFSPGTTRTVLDMMEVAVKDGSGKAAEIPGYRVAGKTGTAQKANPVGGYYAGARITSFVSILPVEAPRYVLLVVVDEPQGSDAYGSTVAAPVAKTVMEALVAIEGIPPSQPITPDASESSP